MGNTVQVKLKKVGIRWRGIISEDPKKTSTEFICDGVYKSIKKIKTNK